MNNIFWDTILKFDFDDPEGEYVFSTRLASENFWTKNFTEIAILEYKKFMYLAATSSSMVSPSEIIDKVWHLHLVYTESYNDFCKLLGKQIKHIPSTHNKKEISKFLDKYKGTPLDWPLRKKWLNYLSKRNRQTLFIEFFQPTSNVELTCQYYQYHL